MGNLVILGLLIAIVGMYLMIDPIKRKPGRPKGGFVGFLQTIWHDYLGLIVTVFGVYFFLIGDPVGLWDILKTYIANPIIVILALILYMERDFKPKILSEVQGDMKKLEDRIGRIEDNLMK